MAIKAAAGQETTGSWIRLRPSDAIRKMETIHKIADQEMASGTLSFAASRK